MKSESNRDTYEFPMFTIMANKWLIALIDTHFLEQMNWAF